MYRPRCIDSSKTKNGRFQSIFFILLVLLVVYILLESPVFEIKGLVVTGNSQMPEQEIIQLSGILPGDNIFKVNMEDSVKNIKLAPLVKSVQVRRKLPSTIEINVVERQAAGLLAVEDGFLVVDDEGIYLRKGNVGSSDLPVITGLAAGAPALGHPVEADGIEVALGVIENIEPQYLASISEIHLSAEKQVCIYSIDGIQGYLGEPVEINKKIQLFFSIVEQFSSGSTGGEIEYIDLSSNGWPVVQMKEVQK